MRVILESLISIKWKACSDLNVTDVFQLNCKLCINMFFCFFARSFLPLTMHAYVQTFVYIFAHDHYYQESNLYIKIFIMFFEMMVYIYP